jgi:hypothetical protein
MRGSSTSICSRFSLWLCCYHRLSIHFLRSLGSSCEPASDSAEVQQQPHPVRTDPTNAERATASSEGSQAAKPLKHQAARHTSCVLSNVPAASLQVQDRTTGTLFA